MVKTGNGDPNRAELYESATKEWNNIKRKDKPEIDDIIRGYLATPYNLCDIQTVRSKSSGSREESLLNLFTFHTVDPVQEISVNASAQKKAANEIQIAEKKLTESNKERIIKLKKNASYSQKCREKKRKILNENQEVIQYDKPGRPSLLFEHPNLHDHIHDSIEFGAADEKRQREVVKVQIIKNLRKTLEENYHIYMAKTTLNNYLLPQQSNSIAARAHHHPAWVAVAGVSRTKIRDHPDGHYCLASVKSARQFATVFADKAVIISQDDKAKIGLGVPAVGQTFRTLQSVHEPVGVADHDFSLGSGQNVDAQYVEELTNPFENLEFEGTVKEKEEERKQQKKKQENENDIPECFVPWSWIENHCNLCQYSLDIKRCTNASCCGPSRAKEATELLLLNNGFLPPITKAKDRHFTNSIYLLEYYDLLKIPGYDSYCPSLDQTTYSRLCCSVCNKYFPTLAYLTKHKKAMHPASRGRPKGKSKNNSNSLDDSSLLTSQQNEMCLREYMSDNE
ncbi:hypothetical protein RirG_111930 [Rhizophagus irregularis DAOM 197198w]|uniref:C2H2-type domain-containing protein n=1 Tax=Rhizophagus irregularis (strain DAOM 197198w) TaxID=1432141 RepID=A0A015JE38_RHIIW|nr:hypothetical protein RirG_111930 [Rhizophagus irregularis DAOM 197198w]